MGFQRWLKFSTVGLLGIAVQLAALQILLKLGMNYLPATAVAVELALLHNFVWHTRWTWRSGDSAQEPRHRLFRFHIANGLISLISNVVWMRVLIGGLHLQPVIANMIAIAATSLLNFALADRWVFADKNSARH